MLFSTVIELLLSLKIFLGRFDMREMKAATEAGGGEARSAPAPLIYDYRERADERGFYFDWAADTGTALQRVRTGSQRRDWRDCGDIDWVIGTPFYLHEIY